MSTISFTTVSKRDGLAGDAGKSYAFSVYGPADDLGVYLYGMDNPNRPRSIQARHKLALRAEILAAYRRATRGRDMGETHDMHVPANVEPVEAAPVTCDHAQELYVIRSGEGVTCLGFEVAERKRRDVLRFLGHHFIAAEVGTVSAYNAYAAAMEMGSDHYDRTGERCPYDLVHELIGLEGARVEVTEQDGGTRRFIVGKSTGWMPCHLEIKRKGAHGGGAVTGAPFRSVRIIEPRA